MTGALGLLSRVLWGRGLHVVYRGAGGQGLSSSSQAGSGCLGETGISDPRRRLSPLPCPLMFLLHLNSQGSVTRSC